MRKIYTLLSLLCFLASTAYASETKFTEDFIFGKPEIKSISILTFGPEGILFIGDSKNGTVVAVDLGDNQSPASPGAFNLDDVEGKLGALLGTTRDNVIIHDLAVNPISQNIYLSVSKGDASQVGFWKLPNDIGYAEILLKITPDKKIQEISLDQVKYSTTNVPSPAKEGDKNWRKSDKRTETITDMSYADGKLFIAGLSNEEFASSLRVLPFPFKDNAATISTIEIWHGAHGKFETTAPIRTFLPYTVNQEPQLLAAYTCTPLVSIPIKDLKNGKHVKSKTLAELGARNMPLDIIAFKKNGKNKILIANTSRSLMSIDVEDIEKQKEAVTHDVEGLNTAGVPYMALPAVGVMQIDNLNDDFVLGLQRMPNGSLDLRSFPTKYL
ncbi:hypothetical protein QQ008_17015 [Fulvivirgaceae bacterium BMA10]|uniref:Uncharacterized protein n=1 Tax=Splendidivirga corallicola TaxID=3051826 RepID=A0ABT8KSC9_9BACT|nr:hypothetical protein [Fulvivirgaceae bacterium BMA10]